jgi:hypothetical protein
MMKRSQATVLGEKDLPAITHLPEALAIRVLPHVLSGEVRARKLAALLPWVAVLVFLQGFHTFVSAPSGPVRELSVLSFLVGGMCAVLSLQIRREMIPPQRALPFGAAILPTILMISLCHLSLAHDSSQVLVVALVIVGAGRLPFPLSWVTAMQIAAVIGWAVVSFVALPADLAFSLMGALAVVALLSSPYMQRRLSSMVGGTFADHDMQSDALLRSGHQAGLIISEQNSGSSGSPPQGRSTISAWSDSEHPLSRWVDTHRC